MKTTLYLLLLVVLSLTNATDFPEEDGVLVLKENTFDEAINQFEYILVEFYAPWCGHCKSLAPEYAKAAKVLKGFATPVPLAKVDATVETALQQRFAIQGYPTLKFFIKGQPIEYDGGRVEAEIVSWLKKKTQPPSSELTSASAIDNFINSNQVAVIFYGEKDSAQFDQFKIVATQLGELSFSHVFDANLRTEKVGTTDPRIILFKKFDEGKNEFNGQFTSAEINTFVSENRHPLIDEFEDYAAERIFGQKKNAIFLFYKQNEEGERVQKAFQEAAETLRGKIVFTKTTNLQGHGKRVSEYLGVKDQEIPTLVILAHSGQDQIKYKYTNQITSESIQQFYQDFSNSKLQPFYKGQDAPANNDEPVKIIVSETFNSIVFDTTKDVLVEFYAPWCGHCKELTPIYENAAKQLAYNKNIVLAKVDATENEIPGVSLTGYPTLRFWGANQKYKPIEFNESRDVDGIIRFLKANMGGRWVEQGASTTTQGEAGASTGTQGETGATATKEDL